MRTSATGRLVDENGAAWAGFTGATIGSANLDGTSLDVTHFFQGLTFGDVRANEINCLVLNGVDGQPETSVVDELPGSCGRSTSASSPRGSPAPRARNS